MPRPYNIPWFNFANLSPGRLNGPNFGHVGWLVPPSPFAPFAAIHPARGKGMYAFFGEEAELSYTRPRTREHVGVAGISAKKGSSLGGLRETFCYNKLRKLDRYSIRRTHVADEPSAGRSISFSSFLFFFHFTRAAFDVRGCSSPSGDDAKNLAKNLFQLSLLLYFCRINLCVFEKNRTTNVLSNLQFNRMSYLFPFFHHMRRNFSDTPPSSSPCDGFIFSPVDHVSSEARKEFPSRRFLSALRFRTAPRLRARDFNFPTRIITARANFRRADASSGLNWL